MNTKKQTSKIKNILRAALIVAPLVWIYSRVNVGTFADTMLSVDPAIVAAIIALVILLQTLHGIKWWALIRKFVPELKLTRAVSVHWESCFYAIALPTAAAQDVVKSVMLSKSHDPSVIWAATWLGRLMGFSALIALSVFGVAYIGEDTLPKGFHIGLLLALSITVTLAALSFSKRITRPMRAVAAKILPQKFLTSAEKLRDGIYAFKHERKTLAFAFLISAVTQITVILSVSLAVYAVAGKLYPAECLAFVPLIEIMAISLPLTPGGMGVREGLMALMFTKIGLTGEQIASYVTISLLMSTVRLLGGIPILLRIRSEKKRAR